MSLPKPSRPEEWTTRWEHAIPVVHHMGVRCTEARRGFASTEVSLEGNTNHVGTMYAGVLFTVAELLGGVIGLTTFDPETFVTIVKDLYIRFRRPASTTVRAQATLDEGTIAAVTASAESDGKADFELIGEITDAHGTVVATTHGTYQVRRAIPRPSSTGSTGDMV